MKYLKTKIKEFNTWKICKKYGIENWKIRDDLVDVDGSVDLYNCGLNAIPIKFGTISGNFACQCNHLKSLKGSPKIVGGHFNCNSNQLTTLKYAPECVEGNFTCYNNRIISLEGAPKFVGGIFNCGDNRFKTLEHFPRVIGDISITYNMLPLEIINNKKYLKQIIELQEDYDIWRDGELYLPRFRELLKDIN